MRVETIFPPEKSLKSIKIAHHTYLSIRVKKWPLGARGGGEGGLWMEPAKVHHSNEKFIYTICT